jgi:hypothetical protein
MDLIGLNYKFHDISIFNYPLQHFILYLIFHQSHKSYYENKLSWLSPTPNQSNKFNHFQTH